MLSKNEKIFCLQLPSYKIISYLSFLESLGLGYYKIFIFSILTLFNKKNYCKECNAIKLKTYYFFQCYLN